MRFPKIFFLCLVSLFFNSLCGANKRMPSTDGGLWCTSFTNFNLEVAALYWRSARADKLYAITSTAVGFEKDFLHTVGTSNHWGVRARLGYNPPCWQPFGFVEYTFFKGHDDDTTLSPQVSYFPQDTSPLALSSVTAKIHDHYQRARADLGFYVWNGCYGNFYTFGGVSWIYLREKDSLQAVPIVSTPIRPVVLHQQMRFRAVGFEVGFGGRYFIRDWIGIAGEFNGVAALGDQQYQFETFIVNAGGQRLENDRPDATICVPGIDLRLETFVRWKCFCPIAFSVGYEYHHFFNVFYGNRLYFGPNNRLVPTQYQETTDIGYGGLFFSGRLNY